jgi:hypothetical protein
MSAAFAYSETLPVAANLSDRNRSLTLVHDAQVSASEPVRTTRRKRLGLFVKTAASMAFFHAWRP